MKSGRGSRFMSFYQSSPRSRPRRIFSWELDRDITVAHRFNQGLGQVKLNHDSNSPRTWPHSWWECSVTNSYSAISMSYGTRSLTSWDEVIVRGESVT